MYQDFSALENERYQRHYALPDFGPEAQAKLRQSKVLVIGAGGLGCPLLMYLAAAGVGQIGIVDADKVERHNLQRQVLYGESDLGQAKARVAARRMADINPHVHVEVMEEMLDRDNAFRIIEGYDVIVDGTDNFPTRYLVNDACVLLGKTNVFASIFRFEGQVSVFNMDLPDGSRGPNYRDIYPVPPAPGTVPDCAEGGVLGVLPGILGTLQATEVIKVLTGIGSPLSGKMLLVDALGMDFRVLRFKKDPQNPISGEKPSITELQDYQQFCGIVSSQGLANAWTAAEFLRFQQEGKAFLLWDVREPWEHALANLGGENLPLSSILDDLPMIPPDMPVVLHCKSGARSRQAIEILTKKGIQGQFINLEGGIEAVEKLLGQSAI